MSREEIIVPPENSKLLAAGRPGRERARPRECTGAEGCYVEIGAPGLIQNSTLNRAPRCAACAGKLYDYSRRY
jgi:hypothetical protein